MAFESATIYVPKINEAGDIELGKLTVRFMLNFRVMHLIGNSGRNTDFNTVMRSAFQTAQIDMPGGLIAQLDDDETMSGTNRANIKLALALAIITLMKRANIKNLDKYLVAGNVDINGNVYPPKGITADALKNFAAAHGLKTLGCTASGADTKIDTLVGLVK